MMPTIAPFDGKKPTIASDVFVAPDAVIIGDVEIGPRSSVWFGVVIRGDVGPIRIGARVNLQDGVIVHLDADAPVTIGEDVTIGHGAIVHGCAVGDRAQIGMGAIVLSGASIGAEAMVAAGAVVAEGATIPAGSVAMGVPARVRREVTDDERRELVERARHYAERGAHYRRLLEASMSDLTESEGGTDGS